MAYELNEKLAGKDVVSSVQFSNELLKMFKQLRVKHAIKFPLYEFTVKLLVCGYVHK